MELNRRASIALVVVILGIIVAIAILGARHEDQQERNEMATSRAEIRKYLDKQDLKFLLQAICTGADAGSEEVCGARAEAIMAQYGDELLACYQNELIADWTDSKRALWCLDKVEN